jgi:hypothetical protein
MNGVLRGLQDRGLLTRPSSAPHGRALPTQLTSAGRERLQAASTAVRAVEQQMLTALTADAQRRLSEDLATCVAALAARGPDELGASTASTDEQATSRSSAAPGDPSSQQPKRHQGSSAVR